MKSMQHSVILVSTILILATPPSLAQSNNTEELIENLLPHRDLPGMRSMRGLEESEGEQSKPSVDIVIEFETGSAEITSGSMRTLRQLGMALSDQRLASYRFMIAGHTDAVGDASSNQTLSERRARSIRDALITLFDIDPARLDTIGYGETQLVDPTEPDAAANRRVQVTNIGSGDNG